jgi:hypothetical protein
MEPAAAGIGFCGIHQGGCGSGCCFRGSLGFLCLGHVLGSSLLGVVDRPVSFQTANELDSAKSLCSQSYLAIVLLMIPPWSVVVVATAVLFVITATSTSVSLSVEALLSVMLSELTLHIWVEAILSCSHLQFNRFVNKLLLSQRLDKSYLL